MVVFRTFFCCCAAVCINVYISMRRLLFFAHILTSFVVRAAAAIGTREQQEHSARSPIASWTVCSKLEAKCSISIKFSNICSAWQRLVALFSYCSCTIFETIFLPLSIWDAQQWGGCNKWGMQGAEGSVGYKGELCRVVNRSIEKCRVVWSSL